LPLGALYATWVVAWMVLGRRPLAGPDDPGSINLVVAVPGVIAGLLLLTAPLGWLMGVGAGMIFAPWWVYCRGGRVAKSVSWLWSCWAGTRPRVRSCKRTRSA
jgi:hypothetical protein